MAFQVSSEELFRPLTNARYRAFETPRNEAQNQAEALDFKGVFSFARVAKKLFSGYNISYFRKGIFRCPASASESQNSATHYALKEGFRESSEIGALSLYEAPHRRALYLKGLLNGNNY